MLVDSNPAECSGVVALRVLGFRVVCQTVKDPRTKSLFVIFGDLSMCSGAIVVTSSCGWRCICQEGLLPLYQYLPPG